MTTKTKKKTNHYVDNKKFLSEIVEYKKQCKIAADEGKEKPRVSEYIGKCIWLIAENLARKPRFMNYSFIDEMKSDALENCFLYFDNFNPEISSNPFAYFTQITNYAFHRRISKEKKNRYIIYKKFQESVLNTPSTFDGVSFDNQSLLVDGSDNHVFNTQMYENLDEFIRSFEEREALKKEKRKKTKEGLDKFLEE